MLIVVGCFACLIPGRRALPAISSRRFASNVNPTESIACRNNGQPSGRSDFFIANFSPAYGKNIDTQSAKMLPKIKYKGFTFLTISGILYLVSLRKGYA